jgi:hypothetical protein
VGIGAMREGRVEGPYGTGILLEGIAHCSSTRRIAAPGGSSHAVHPDSEDAKRS